MKVNKTKVVVFNGAPGSGKDTFGEMLETWIDNDNTYDGDIFKDKFNDQAYGYIESFKTELIDFVLNFYDIKSYIWDKRYETKKDKPWYKLKGLSQRQALIEMSEDRIKLVLGDDYFGKCVAREITNNGNVHILTDSGFEQELQPIIDKVGVENVIVFRLHRDGHTFDGDSRSLLTNDMFNGDVDMIDIKSDDIDETFERILKEFLSWIHA